MPLGNAEDYCVVGAMLEGNADESKIEMVRTRIPIQIILFLLK